MLAFSTCRVWGLLLLCLPFAGLAQPKCKIDHYTTEDGLSSDRITSILKDEEGFLWFGTWDGIDRFDGHDFVTYKSYPGDQSQLKNDRIDAITEDKTFYLWLRDYDQQAYRFDKRTGQFLPMSDMIKAPHGQKMRFDRILSNDKGTVWLLSREHGIYYIPNTDLPAGHYQSFAAGLDKQHQLPANHINFFYEDDSHTVWVGTPQGLAQLVKDQAGNYRNSGLVIGPGALHYTGITEDAQQVYCCTEEGYFITYNKATHNAKYKQLSAGKLNGLCVSKKRPVVYCSTASGQLLAIRITDQSMLPTGFAVKEAVNGIYEDQTGCLWIEPAEEGIIRFDPLSGAINKYVQSKDANFNYRNEHAKVYEDNKGVVWASLKTCGFGYYNPATHSFEYFYNGPNPETHKFSNMVTCLYYDKSGILWMSTDTRGVDKIIFSGDYFDQHPLVNNTILRSENEVRGIYTDRANRLWVGTKIGKLYIRKEGKDVPVRFVGEPKEGFGPVYSILEDHTGVIWLGTKQNGLFKAEPLDKSGLNYQVTHYKDDEKDAYSINGNDVYTLAEDRSGRVWAGTFDKGLNQVVTVDHHTSFLNARNLYRQYPPNAFNKIRHIAFDQYDHLWIGTTTGLLVMDAPAGTNPADARFVTYSKIPGDKESLGNNDIQFVFKDSHQTMWLLTSGGGLSKSLSPNAFKGLSFRNYTISDGLPNDYLLSCLEDKQGNLWLSTQKGISRFNANTGQIRNYDSDDGLLKTEYAEAAGTKLADGTLVFGTIKGYLSFNPEKIYDQKIDTRIVFTNLQVNNQDRVNGDKDSILAANINYTDALQLNYNQNNISIDYTVLDYRSLNKQDYVYQLKGFDTGWHNNQSQRRATYTNLSPGHYTFEVKSASDALYLHSPVKSVEITILPPPWRTWWAYLLYVLVGSIILAVVKRNALAMLRLRQRIAVEQKMTELKLNFFTNISHELRTPLTLILNPIQQIASRENLSQQGKAYADIVQRNANRMVRFINQLLDLRKVQSGKATLKISAVEMVAFTQRIGEYFADIAREKQIGLEITANAEAIPVFIDAEKMDIVIYNLLANAFKFSPPNKHIGVCITQSLEKGTVTIEITDEGSGVPDKMLQDIFELYFEEDHSNGKQPIKGSGIGLALSKELVVLHHGKIWAANTVPGGLRVSIELLLGKAHFPAGETKWIDLPEAFRTVDEGTKLVRPALAANTLTYPTPADLPLLLLVEDNFELQTFLQSQLSTAFRVEVASNGEEGLEQALRLVPDIIVSDVMMPQMDGITMLDHLKNNMVTSHIPVVLLSAKSSIEDQIEGLQYGADLYMTKPFNNELLLASLANLLERRKKLFELLAVTKEVSPEINPGAITITSRDELFLKDVVAIVENGMADPDFNIDLVAASMNMGRSTFYKKFKSLTNLAPVEFIRDMRLKRSKQYMDAGETNIASIAYAVGFNDAKYFSTCFKEKFHLTPSEYLKNPVKEWQ